MDLTGHVAQRVVGEQRTLAGFAILQGQDDAGEGRKKRSQAWEQGQRASVLP